MGAFVCFDYFEPMQKAQNEALPFQSFSLSLVLPQVTAVLQPRPWGPWRDLRENQEVHVPALGDWG